MISQLLTQACWTLPEFGGRDRDRDREGFGFGFGFGFGVGVGVPTLRKGKGLTLTFEFLPSLKRRKGNINNNLNTRGFYE